MNSCLFYICSRTQAKFDRSKRHLTEIPKDIVRQENSVLEVNLQYNQISHLDKCLFRCKRIERLYLNDNCLQEIPGEVSALTRLEELYLARNDLAEISNGIKFCTKLTYLDISSNNLKHIPDGITQLKNLQVLLLNDVSLTEIPSSISSLCNLRVLEARDNLIKEIPESISFLSMLSRLDLGCNEIASLPETIGQLECLTEFWLDTNVLNSLPNEMGDLKNLEILELSNNPLQFLPDRICRLKMLTDLTLSSNPLSELPNNFGELKELKILKIDFNQLKCLPDSICDLPNLSELYLSGNFLTSLPQNFGKLKSLRCLHLDYNSLTGLPDSICECGELSIFSMRDNAIEILPTNIGHLSKLTVLDVSGNRLKFLPCSILKLKKIRAIWLSKTQQKSYYDLQTEEHVVYGKVLTNFLLPQNPSKYSPASSRFGSGSDISVIAANQKSPPVNDPKLINGEILAKSGRSGSLTPQVHSSKIDQLCILNSVKSETRGSKDDLKNVRFEQPIKNFSTDIIRLFKDKHGFGIELEEIEATNETSFGLADSSIIIKSVKEFSPAHNCGKLRTGDRILEINDIGVSQMGLSYALPLMKLKGDTLDLMVRHDPPLSQFKRVCINRDSVEQKLGIGVKSIPVREEDWGTTILVVSHIDQNHIKDVDDLKIGDVIVEINDLLMFNKSGEDFKSVANNLTKVELMIYRNNRPSLVR